MRIKESRVKRKLVIAFILLSVLGFSQKQELSDIESSNIKVENGILFFKAHNLQKVLMKFPDKFDPEKKYPLLIVLHGNGGRAKDIASVFLPFSKEDVIIAFPEGQYPKPMNGAIGFSWYIETNEKDIWELADEYTVENIYELINAINSKYKIDKNYVFGFSQGASLAYMTGIKYYELISGMIAVGGILPQIDKKGSVISAENIENAKHVKVIVARGNADNLTGEKQFLYQKKVFEKNGYNAFCFEYEGGHYLSKELLDKVFIWIQKDLEK